MHIDIDWDRVIDLESDFADDVYTIAVVFDDYQVCTYGYSDKKEFMKDYTRIIEGKKQ